MKLTILGCSGTVPGPASPASGYLLEHEGAALVLDMGNGCFGTLQRFIAPEAVSAVVISHLHPDHFVDLCAYSTYLRWAPHRPFPRLALYGPAQSMTRLDQAYGPTSGSFDELWDFTESTVAGEITVGPFSLSFTRVRHPGHSYAVRVQAGGRALVYSGDTGPCAELVTLARGADVLLCEASFGPQEQFVPDLHLTAAMAAEHALAAGVGRLIVTHMPPWTSAEVAVALASGVFPGHVVAARQDEQFQI